MKLVREEIADDADFRARFRREVAACRAVRAQCTAAVLASDADSPQPWLATEYIPGPSLHELVRAAGPLDARLLSTLALGLAEALVAIHRAGSARVRPAHSGIMRAGGSTSAVGAGLSRALGDHAAARWAAFHGEYAAPRPPDSYTLSPQAMHVARLRVGQTGLDPAVKPIARSTVTDTPPLVNSTIPTT
ncbi:hypothetical protein FRACA_1440012 [Frankia canadensis]|uniref:Aminoglycoside phosphotransferase domain-containing protein n=1 Tax=Frankia canadensis TaxID=1836972 RepID=A0A2I2KLK8_9ACTN|nr:hypothetical protein FRACA_1440012 [Frankia canadensis]SOU53838.1 hypothetical protein FRACA_1440012 [Frankia canadensis]